MERFTEDELKILHDALESWVAAGKQDVRDCQKAMKVAAEMTESNVMTILPDDIRERLRDRLLGAARKDEANFIDIAKARQASAIKLRAKLYTIREDYDLQDALRGKSKDKAN